MNDDWNDVADWWIDTVRDDPANSVDLLEILAALVPGRLTGMTLDVGCGEGQAMRSLDGTVIGTDLVAPLLRIAATTGPVVQARLPDIGWARTGSFDRCVCVGVIEVIDDLDALFGELRRVTRAGGELVAVTNHPVTTAPGGEPMIDPTGELFWRWGSYLHTGTVNQAVDHHSVVLHHRPFGELMSAAARAGWQLAELTERGPSTATLARHPDYAGNADVPTLAGMRWTAGEVVSPARTDASS